MERLTVFLAHAAEDAPAAAQLAQFLERGARVTAILNEGRIEPGGSLLEKMDEGLTADVLLALLSPASLRGPWRREEWIPAFEDNPRENGVPVATVLLRDCKFPELLRRRNFFDLTREKLSGARSIQRWMMQLRQRSREPLFAPVSLPSFSGRAHELDRLCVLLADNPGVATLCGPEQSGKTALALEFARRHEEAFEWTIWLSARGRSLAEIAGDLAWQLGLRVEEDLEAACNRLLIACSSRRTLIVLDGVEDDDVTCLAPARLVPDGHASLLVTAADTDFALAFGPEVLEMEHQGDSRPQLNTNESALLAALAACPEEFDPEVAAEIAWLDTDESRAALAGLRSAGLACELDRNSGSRWISLATRAAVQEEHADRYSAAVARRAGRWTASADPARLLPQLMHAIRRAIERSGSEASGGPSWETARALGQTAVAIQRHLGRLAEAHLLLWNLEQSARERQDRRAVDSFLWERAWILDAWGRGAEAEALNAERREFFSGQIAFDFS